jgi:hypothetical protein
MRKLMISLTKEDAAESSKDAHHVRFESDRRLNTVEIRRRGEVHDRTARHDGRLFRERLCVGFVNELMSGCERAMATRLLGRRSERKREVRGWWVGGSEVRYLWLSKLVR